MAAGVERDEASRDTPSERVEVALADAGGLPASLTYALPPHLVGAVGPGSFVSVPLGPRRVTGVVLGPAAGEPPRGLKAIASVVPGVHVPAELLELARWAARYYRAPLASLLRAAMPPAVRRATRRRVRLIEPPAAAAIESAARASRTGARGPTLEERVLARLTPAGLDVAQLGQELGASAVAAARRLAARGLVAIEEVDIARRPEAPPLRAAAGATPDDPALARSPRQRAVLDYVRARAPHPVLPSEIEERVEGGRRAAEALLRRGLLVRDSADPADASNRLGDLGDGEAAERPRSVALHPEQASALERIDAAAGTFRPLLLLGVTGSGKTEVYLRAAERALARGAGVLLLVPEIGLTHQLVVQVARRFGARAAVLHSGLADGERAAAWRDLATGRKPIAVGARSAIFAPVRDLGLVVVDEEHDAAYKQEESPRYNARDLAVMRAKLAGCPAVLASATPSLESYHAARSGRYELIELRERANRAAMPIVEIVDLRREAPARGPDARARPGGAPEEATGAAPRPAPVLLSRTLEDALLATYRSGDQSVLFLNRRGYARFLQCEACGHVETCPDCSVSLTVHRSRRAAVCHHCGYARPPATACRQCDALLAARSFGTEQIEAAVRRLLPAARVARLDRDTASHPAFVRSTLAAWRAGELDVLVGTQMVAKGHDAPGVTLIGVVLADASLNFPDFRAAERTFQLLAQVAGRAGRGAKPGRVVVQTRQPEHPSLVAASRHDFEGFAAEEMRARRELGYPPFGRLARIVLEGEARAAERAAEAAGTRLRAAARAAGAHATGGAVILGPAPAPLEKLRGRHRHQVLVKAPDSRTIARVLSAARLDAERLERAAPASDRGVRTVVDVDPISML
ncbi:MAG TPA: primosomal protein N' [Candidatus Binatia bacterium]|nr:primosomal protein N' [Candidatus Binatia bacterium]